MTCHEIFTKDNFILGRLISSESSNKLREGETEVPPVGNLVTRSDSCSEWPFRGNSLPSFSVEKVYNAELGSVNKKQQKARLQFSFQITIFRSLLSLLDTDVAHVILADR